MRFSLLCSVKRTAFLSSALNKSTGDQDQLQYRRLHVPSQADLLLHGEMVKEAACVLHGSNVESCCLGLKNLAWCRAEGGMGGWASFPDTKEEAACPCSAERTH